MLPYIQIKQARTTMSTRLMKRMLGRKQAKDTPVIKPRDKQTLQMEYTKLASQLGDAHYRIGLFEKLIKDSTNEMDRISHEMELVLKEEQRNQPIPSTEAQQNAPEAP